MPKSINRRTRIGRLRALVNASVEEFAEMGGVSPHAIRSLEIGRLKLSRKVAEAIAFGTGVDAAWLLGTGRIDAPTSFDAAEAKTVPYTRCQYDARKSENLSGPLNPSLQRIYQVRSKQLLAFFRAAERKGRVAPALHLFQRFLEESVARMIQSKTDQHRFQQIVSEEFEKELYADKRRAIEEQARWQQVMDAMAQNGSSASSKRRHNQLRPHMPAAVSKQNEGPGKKKSG